MRPLAQQPRAAGFFERPVWASAAERSEWKTQNDTTRRSPVPHSSSDNTFVPAPQTAQKEAVWLCPDSKEEKGVVWEPSGEWRKRHHVS